MGNVKNEWGRERDVGKLLINAEAIKEKVLSGVETVKNKAREIRKRWITDR